MTVLFTHGEGVGYLPRQIKGFFHGSNEPYG
jgi:hypothetical protein